MEKLSDEELVARCQAELPYQTKSFEMLIDRYKQKVFGKAVSMLKNEEEARDLTQDIFVKVFHGLPAFRREASFSTWLYAITVNPCLNHLEKMQRRPWWWLAEDVEALREAQQEEAEIFLAIGRSLEREELRRMIDRTLNSLNDKSREILRLRHFEELDYETIAGRLGIGLSAAKMRLKRAREEFKLQYEKLAKGK
jgi:RNA polymerase sigma-70 factor (ECF subfamily)